MRGCGCTGRPAFRTPSFRRGGTFTGKARAHGVARSRSRICCLKFESGKMRFRIPGAMRRVALAKRCFAEPGPRFLRNRAQPGPRLCSAPLREELRAALRPGHGRRKRNKSSQIGVIGPFCRACEMPGLGSRSRPKAFGGIVMSVIVRAACVAVACWLFPVEMAAAQPANMGCATENSANAAQTLRCEGGVTIVAENGARFTLQDRDGNGRVDSAELSSKALLLDVPKKSGRKSLSGDHAAGDRGGARHQMGGRCGGRQDVGFCRQRPGRRRAANG